MQKYLSCNTMMQCEYGSCSGKYQELEGTGEAEKLLQQLGDFTAEQI